MRYYLLVLCSVLVLRTLAQPLANGREMGFAVSEPENNDFDQAFIYAQDACMKTIHISFRWSALRPDTTSWGSPALNLLDICNIYFPLANTKVELQLQPTNTVVDEMPEELMGLPYDHPLVISEFNRTLDTVFAHIPNVQLAALNIGNESDVLWQIDGLKYQQFGAFLQVVKPYAQALYQGTQGDTLSVGTTFTWGGLTNSLQGPLCQITNVSGDHISATYYGITQGFLVKPPTDVITDINDLVTLHPGNKPIRFAEIGYPTSAVCSSSEQLQSEFIEAMFSAWDTHMDRIKYMGYFLTTDWSQATVDTLAVYYGISDPAFLEYLRTLGLRTNPDAGMHKAAYYTMLCELNAREFCPAAFAIGLDERLGPDPFLVAPNPASDVLFITVPDQGANKIVEFIGLNGQGAHSVVYSDPMNIKHIPRGMYALRCSGHSLGLVLLQ